jgi:hypothetical protein
MSPCASRPQINQRKSMNRVLLAIASRLRFVSPRASRLEINQRKSILLLP